MLLSQRCSYPPATAGIIEMRAPSGMGEGLRSRPKLLTLYVLRALLSLVAGLDEISGGRFVFGLGAGHAWPGQARAFGLPEDRIFDRFDEALRIVLDTFPDRGQRPEFLSDPRRRPLRDLAEQARVQGVRAEAAGYRQDLHHALTKKSSTFSAFAMTCSRCTRACVSAHRPRP